MSKRHRCRIPIRRRNDGDFTHRHFPNSPPPRLFLRTASKDGVVFVCAFYRQQRTFRPSTVEPAARTGGGSSRFASMRSVVLPDSLSSLCFVLIMVHAVLRLRPSAFAWLSKEIYPAATMASAICWIFTAYLSCASRRLEISPWQCLSFMMSLTQTDTKRRTNSDCKKLVLHRGRRAYLGYRGTENWSHCFKSP